MVAPAIQHRCRRCHRAATSGRACLVRVRARVGVRVRVRVRVGIRFRVRFRRLVRLTPLDIIRGVL